jgi:cytoskeletal protein CcmA (bactofilin family)
MWNPSTQPTATNSKSADALKAVPNTTPANFEPAPAASPRNAAPTQEQATIGKSLVVKGEVTGSESLYVDGRVEGTINLPGNRVTVGRNGQVQADITAREIVVLGAVTGNLTASDRVEVRSEGSLTGDVSCQRISIEDGAFFKGGIDVRKPTGKENGHAKEDNHAESRLAAALA